MTYLGASAAALATDRNTWHTRADQAWGDSRVWNNAISFEADRNYWKNTVAHGDADVWNTRYNAGYAQATTDKQPPATVVEATANAGEFLYSAVQAYCSVAVPRTGYYFAVAQATSVTTSAGILLTFMWNNSYLGDQYNWNPPTNNERIGTLICATPRLITAGQSITFRGDAGGTAARTGTHTLRAVFVPTQAYPH